MVTKKARLQSLAFLLLVSASFRGDEYATNHACYQKSKSEHCNPLSEDIRVGINPVKAHARGLIQRSAPAPLRREGDSGEKLIQDAHWFSPFGQSAHKKGRPKAPQFIPLQDRETCRPPIAQHNTENHSQGRLESPYQAASLELASAGA